MREMTKAAFLDTMREKRHRWNALLSEFQDEDLDRPGVSGMMSARDIIVHVTAYERGLVEWLEAASEGEVKAFPILDHSDVDYRNKKILEEGRLLSVEQAKAAAGENFIRLIGIIETISEDELLDPDSAAWYVVPRWRQKRALWECIADDSYRHYDQHIGDIQEWLSGETR